MIDINLHLTNVTIGNILNKIIIHCSYDDISFDDLKAFGKGKMIQDDMIGGYLRYQPIENLIIFLN